MTEVVLPALCLAPLAFQIVLFPELDLATTLDQFLVCYDRSVCPIV